MEYWSLGLYLREESGIKDDSGMQDVQYTEVSFRWRKGIDGVWAFCPGFVPDFQHKREKSCILTHLAYIANGKKRVILCNNFTG